MLVETLPKMATRSRSSCTPKRKSLSLLGMVRSRAEQVADSMARFFIRCDVQDLPMKRVEPKSDRQQYPRGIQEGRIYKHMRL